MLRTLGLAFALLLGAAAIAPAHADAPTPDQVVQGIADDLGKAIEGHQAELKSDHDKLIKIIDGILLPRFDIDYASILVLGQNARTATPEQRARFAKAFYNSIAHRYAEGLLNYTKGRVRVLPSNGDLNDKRSIVRTQVVLDDGKTLGVDYAFRKTKEGDWKAYDVIIEGISYITNYRNQVGAEIQKSSLDALITRLETQGEKTLENMEHTQQGGQ
jgi:phospholipid transport system substrate-binding protein